ncbi:MAG: hypothetical protein JWO04_821 [Gammaproteobacteria bacterium]|nr:hypothetical protein [Gammaproteobacteria bacterium]
MQISGMVSAVSTQLCRSPMNDILGVAKVLPMGELQQPAYQRSSPFSVSRMQASASIPWVKIMFFGRIPLLS